LVAYTQQQVIDLKAAIAGGQLMVRSGDRSIQYRSLDEMQRLLRIMEDELAGLSGTNGLVLGRRNYAAFRRD
jgi:hypothetical protein